MADTSAKKELFPKIAYPQLKAEAFAPPRPLEEIEENLKKIEREIAEMMAGAAA